MPPYNSPALAGIRKAAPSGGMTGTPIQAKTPFIPPSPQQAEAERQRRLAQMQAENAANIEASRARGQQDLENDRQRQAAQQTQQAQLQQAAYGSAPNVQGFVGENPVTQGGYEDQALAQLQNQGQESQLNLKAKLSGEAWDKRLSAIQPMLGQFGGGGISDQPWQGGDGGEGVASAAAFARAKDRQGQTSRAALDSLSSVMSETGNLGGGRELGGIADILGSAAGGLGEFERDQAIFGANRSASVADRNYAGNLQKRQQDLQMQQSLLGLLNMAGSLY